MPCIQAPFHIQALSREDPRGLCPRAPAKGIKSPWQSARQRLAALALPAFPSREPAWKLQKKTGFAPLM